MRTSVPSVPLVKHLEGEYRPGPWLLPITGGWLPHEVGIHTNFWQNGYNPVSGGTSAMVEACVAAYAQTIAMCPGDHWLKNAKEGRDRVTTSALSRILKRPNSYQSASDFFLNLTRSLYCEGEAFALALRNDRFEIKELHLMRADNCHAHIAVTGDVFYSLSGNEIIEKMADGKKVIAPARDVLHVRMHTPDHPLKGVSPITAAAIDVAASNAMMQQQLIFYLNQARPSFGLGTEQILTEDQAKELRERWDAQSRGLNQGGTPILSAGLKVIPFASPARDSQLAEIMKMSEQNIALVFRVPLQILGIGGTPFASTEALMQFWLAGGLNFTLNHIEVAFDNLFGLKGQPDEYMELNTDVLLRSALRDRVESYAAGTRAGIFSPNEARSQFELPKVADGDEPRMQQQDVPLSFGAELEPPKPAEPAEPEEPEDEPEDAKAAAIDSNAIVSRLYDYADRIP